MNTAYFYLTEEGRRLCIRLAASHPGDIYGKEDFKNKLKEAFSRYDYLVCIMAAGIVVRILAPLIVHKTSDPGVVVMDQRGQYAISLLSGHLGGANDLAREMAHLSGGQPVITTATDVAGELSFDTFAKLHHMAIENISELKHISGALLSGQRVTVISDYSFPELEEASSSGKMILLSKKQAIDPAGVSMEDQEKADVPDSTGGFMADQEKADAPDLVPTAVVIDEGFVLPQDMASRFSAVLYLRPRTICAGIGCKRNMDAAPIEAALRQVLKEEGFSPLSLQCISTIPLKSDEPGIVATARQLKVPLKIIPTEEIEQLDTQALHIRGSDFVAAQTGVVSVSTASSYLASGKGTIIRDKAKFKGITIALSKSKREFIS